ncbi:MAG: hypothetical protein LBI33_07940 [Propionibacteriaceae bacterium]|jgi:hypothetical protein|nr:hypothetical protein [Propionibacteriaceae bacterium]
MSGSLNLKNNTAVTAIRCLASQDEERRHCEAQRVERALSAYRVHATNLGGTDDDMYDPIGLPRW